MTGLATMDRYCDTNRLQSSEEELYFEMDFERRKERSVEPELSLAVREERRGSSVGPILERPKYLRNISNYEK